jgi:UDP-N-acetylmuramoyl-tripeptide--D-alanyl-D-alanine ligase
MKRAIFLDRDGTINVDYGFVSAPEKFQFLPYALDGLKKMTSLGFLLIIVSNQSGIGRNYYTLQDYEAVTAHMVKLLKDHQIILDDFYYCPHSPESNCACRKPATKMLTDAIQKWNIDPSQSFLVGDKESDIRAGIRVGVKTFLIAQKEVAHGQDFRLNNLLEVAEKIETFLEREALGKLL